MVAEFEKDIKAVLPTAAPAPEVTEPAPPVEDEDDEGDIDGEAQQLLQDQEYTHTLACQVTNLYNREQKRRFEEVRKKAMAKAVAPAAKAPAKKEAEAEDDDLDADDIDDLLLDWRSKNV